jgi:hypothetical protein
MGRWAEARPMEYDMLPPCRILLVLVMLCTSVSCKNVVATGPPRAGVAATRPNTASSDGEAKQGVGRCGLLAKSGRPNSLKRPIFDDAGGATKIVFVCDASGSMVGNFHSLKDELAKAFHALRVPQSFDIVFFQDGKTIVFSRDSLKTDEWALATDDIKRSASTFLEDVTTDSLSDPLPALRAALARQPDLVYLLTDGEFPDNEAVLKTVRDLNRRRDRTRARVNTILFADDKDTDDTPAVKVLTMIATENGGTFRRTSQNELNGE